MKSHTLTSLQLYLKICLCLIDFNMTEMYINPSMCLYIFLNHDQDGRITKGKPQYFINIVLYLIIMFQGQYVLYSTQLRFTTSFLVNLSSWG